MISVPEAGTLPKTPCPIAAENGSMISGGNPSGYSGNGVSSRMPIISQWPVVVSLPAENSVARPCAVPGSARGAMPSIWVNRPSPRPSSAGASRPPTDRATCDSVSDPVSPYPSASGASPIPQESQTSTHTRDTSRDGTSADQLLAVDAQRRPWDRVQALFADGVAAPLAAAVRAVVDLLDRAFDLAEVHPQRTSHRHHALAFLGAVRAVGEARIGVERHLGGLGARAGAAPPAAGGGAGAGAAPPSYTRSSLFPPPRPPPFLPPLFPAPPRRPAA